MPYLSVREAARRLSCSTNTVGRIAKRLGLGVRVESGRLTAVSECDLPEIRPYLHAGPGNPGRKTPCKIGVFE